jgi:hypothetical protein
MQKIANRGGQKPPTSSSIPQGKSEQRMNRTRTERTKRQPKQTEAENMNETTETETTEQPTPDEPTCGKGHPIVAVSGSGIPFCALGCSSESSRAPVTLMAEYRLEEDRRIQVAEFWHKFSAEGKR